MLTGCIANYNSGDGYTYRYGFYDAYQSGTAASLNQIVGCRAYGAGTADYYRPGWASNPVEAMGRSSAADGDTTPSVKSTNILHFGNTGATSVTMFDDGVEGQRLVVISPDSPTNTTIVEGSNLKLQGSANITLVPYIPLFFQFYNGTWYQIAQSSSFIEVTTAAGAGTDGTISSRSANPLGECDGFLKMYKSDGTVVYLPYWESIAP